MEILHVDVLVAGAGSGGIGAALGAAEKGASVLLMDAHQTPGGVVAYSWVHNWEPTCGNGPLSHRLWNRMRKMELGAANMEFTTSRIHPDGTRQDTMPFELWAYLRAVDAEFKTYGVQFSGGTCIERVEVRNNRIVRAFCKCGPVCFAVDAACYIDATDSLIIAAESGCTRMLGTDSKADFQEPDAPEQGDRHKLNAVNWIYRVRRNAQAPVSLPEDVDLIRGNIRAFFSAAMPNGDLLVNICGAGNFDPENPEDYRRVWMQQYRLAQDTFFCLSRRYPDWQLVGFAPEMGIRESYRLRARYIMTEQDVLSGGIKYADRFVAETNHPLDIHGTNLINRGVFRYGICYDSLLPPEIDNLWVASRGIGASHIVSGSCRLSRTVMTFGEAAGRAAALAAKRRCASDEISPREIASYDHGI